MNIAHRLDQVNQRFYDQIADDFHQSRKYGWRGWRALIDSLPSSPLSILDIGCGNARLLDFLERTWRDELSGELTAYRGLDRCIPLLNYARERFTDSSYTFEEWSWLDALQTDDSITKDSKGERAQLSSSDTGYSWVTMFGVMHHVFGYQNRLNLLKWAAGHLAPGGTLSVSFWDFGSHERWSKKMIDWSIFAEEWGIDLSKLESGDMLLGWSHLPSTPRYCHWVNREEEARLISELCASQGVEGRSITLEGDLNRYVSWRRPESTA
jgi:tRNA (uracil-5-)-methyltransferase TRM9